MLRVSIQASKVAEEEEEKEEGHRESHQSRNPLGKFYDWSRVKQEASWWIGRLEEGSHRFHFETGFTEKCSQNKKE